VSLTRRRRFRITDAGLQVFAGNLNVRRTFTVPLSALLDEPSEEMVASRFWFTLSILFSIATALALAILIVDSRRAERAAPVVWAVLTAVALLFYLKSRRVWLIWQSDDKVISMLKDVPSADLARAFVQSVRSVACVQIRDTTLAESEDETDRLQRLRWLREKGIISEAEFTDLAAGFGGTSTTASEAN